MQLQLTLIGLGEIGASVGLALRYQKKDIFRVGLDSRKSAEEAAKRVDAVDKIEHSYADAVKKTQVFSFLVSFSAHFSMVCDIYEQFKESINTFHN